MSSEINWNLSSILDNDLHITPNKLAVEAKLRPLTIYKIYNNEASRIHLPNVLIILDTLNEIAYEKGVKKFYTPGDLFEYIYKK